MEYTLERFETETDVESYVRDFVDIEGFLECCKVCPAYGKTWSCPPFDFDPLEFWNSYEKVRIAGYRLTFGEDRTREEMDAALWDVKKKLTDELYELEKEIPGSVALSAGSCQFCKSCTKPEGKPCRFPEKMHHSLESLGADLGKTTTDMFGIEMKWIENDELPDYFAEVGGLLIKE